ncbi:MFS general substrate transporter [Aspergillus fijiensis CBS 313.89]|uniref:MFS general substrate transporter n=1 Tax=Aspergillus fijiensis CBS 313.89 TaxID=1448319 RepID=A0A8G1RUX3_9EURO|nr:MFS general substrate transporter [Aspergillus fijiensis CBS 313.89]RAK79349.1 MFS general substrate transporter [Aspergillus fijiensis CBS 313.89]
MAEIRKDVTSDHLEYSDDGNTTKGQDSDLVRNIRNLPDHERQQLEKKLVRKVDIRLLIMIVVMYILNYLDRNNIAAAKLAGLETDLNLKGDQYQISVSILFIGYLLMQVPSNMILNKLGKPSLYLPGCMLVWGVISCATAATHNFTGLLLCRFFLGFVEAAYFPGCLYLLSAWYTRKELGKRTALLYSGSLLSGAFSGLISAGITSGLNGARGLGAWRWLFIIEGSLTVFVAFISFFIIPDLPRTTRWLSEEEKALAAWRLEADIGEDDWVDQQHQSMLHGAKLAFLDIKAWLLLGTIYGCTASGAVTTFFPSVMAGLGKNNIDTLLLTTPPYLIGTIFVLINAWHADLTGERYLHIVLPPILAIVSFILAMAGSSFAARYVAMCIMLPGIYSSYVVALGYISNILPRPATKRAAALALINCLSNVCQIYTPYLYPNSASPRYITAFSVNIAMSSMTIIFATILRLYLGRLNKRLDREEGTSMGASNSQRHDNEEHGLPGQAVTRGFRFLL